MTGDLYSELSTEELLEIEQHLRDYAARRRADGAKTKALEITQLADGIRKETDSNWQDCPECGCQATVLSEQKNVLECERCERRFMVA